MSCKPMIGTNGQVIGISCRREGDKKEVCHICGKPMTSLCDATRKDGEPCDLPMCDEHRNKVGPDTDVCKYHNYPKYIEEAKNNRIDLEKKRIESAREMQEQVQSFIDHAKRQKRDVMIKASFDELFEEE